VLTKDAHLVLRNPGVLSALKLVDAVVLAAILKIKERRCRSSRDFFHLIEHTRGLTTHIAPVQNESEIVGLLAMASKLPLECALEIGTGSGGTFYLLCKVAKPNATLLTIDILRDPKRTLLLKLCSNKQQEIHIIDGSSRDDKTVKEVVRALGSRRLDLLFIDGDHSFAGVSGDFKLYSRFVRPGGIVALHDIVADHRTQRGVQTPGYTGDVPAFWKVIKTRWKSQELVESYHQDGKGIGIIYWDPQEENV
jgi:predicted O-methyltransferase YrrM